jgi:hypothetical protein
MRRRSGDDAQPVGRHGGRTEPRIKLRASTTNEGRARIVAVTHGSKASTNPTRSCLRRFGDS